LLRDGYIAYLVVLCEDQHMVVYLDMLELCMVPQLENIPTIRHFSTLW
jgi:hypothetical protein